MPRRILNLVALFAGLLLASGCERRHPAGTARVPVTLSTNTTELTAALRSRDPEIREVAAQYIALHSIPVDPSVLIRGLDDSDPNVRRNCAAALGRMRVTEAIRPLFMLLRDDNWYVRAEAASALGQLGDERAVGWLVQLLDDSDPYVRLCAGTALRQLTTDSHRALLLQAYARATPKAKVALAIALAKLKEPVAIDQLISAARTNDVTLRRQTAEALGDYPPAAVTNVLTQMASDPDASVRDEAIRALQRTQSSPVVNR
jgi:HEAT repeat protein